MRETSLSGNAGQADQQEAIMMRPFVALLLMCSLCAGAARADDWIGGAARSAKAASAPDKLEGKLLDTPIINSGIALFPIKVEAKKFLPQVAFSSDGKSMLLAEWAGVIRVIDLGEFKETGCVALGHPIVEFARTRAGLAAVLQTQGQIWVLDERTLAVRHKIDLPKVGHIASATQSDIALATGAQYDTWNAHIVDLAAGKVLKTTSAMEFSAAARGRHPQWKIAGTGPYLTLTCFDLLRMAPDGVHLMVSNMYSRHRLRLDRETLVYEDISKTTGSEPTAAIFSPDSLYFCNGLYDPTRGVFRSDNLDTPFLKFKVTNNQMTLNFAALAFDPKGRRIWVGGDYWVLTEFDFTGGVRRSCTLRDSGAAMTLALHPEGKFMAVQTDRRMFWAELDHDKAAEKPRP
jgi:hypothetical protein